MKTRMIEHFEVVLNAMSDADFEAMWEEVDREGNGGITADALVASFAYTPAAVAARPVIHYSMDNLTVFGSAGEYNYAMAA